MADQPTPSTSVATGGPPAGGTSQVVVRARWTADGTRIVTARGDDHDTVVDAIACAWAAETRARLMVTSARHDGTAWTATFTSMEAQ